MKKSTKKNEILGVLTDIHGSSVQDTVDILQEILKKDPDATFSVKLMPNYNTQLSVDYEEKPSIEAANAGDDYPIYDQADDALYLGEVHKMNDGIHYAVDDAPTLSKDNHDIITDETQCGCYFCFRLFNGASIEEWIDDDKTALCPYCGIDSVIPCINDVNFLVKAGERWFTGIASMDQDG